MRIDVLLPVLSAILASMLLTRTVRSLALAYGFMDVPNRRSSHSSPTPRSGGLAIVLTTSIGLVCLTALHFLDGPLCYALLGGIAVAAVGLADDRRPVPPIGRLVVHTAAAVWALYWLQGLPPIRIGDSLLSLHGVGYGIRITWIVWAVNLFNFMDGIDGIAASEAVFIALGGALLTGGSSSTVGAAALLFAGACTGFLVWNWPPAKIFLGDVGSGYVGYVIAVLAIASSRYQPSTPWIWITLSGVFIVDATVTLLRRALRGERVHVAHRSHAYQWLVRRWLSHRRVTLAVMALNVLWLAPWALVAHGHPKWAQWITLIALFPLSGLVMAIGAGRPDRNEQGRLMELRSGPG